MCRNIHTLYNYEPPATNEEIHDASLQYVRKVSGFTKPSQAKRQLSPARSTKSPELRRVCWSNS